MLMLSEFPLPRQPNFLLQAAGRLRTVLTQMRAASANKLAERKSTAYMSRIFTNLGIERSRLLSSAHDGHQPIGPGHGSRSWVSVMGLVMCEDDPAQYVETSSRTKRVYGGDIIAAPAGPKRITPLLKSVVSSSAKSPDRCIKLKKRIGTAVAGTA